MDDVFDEENSDSNRFWGYILSVENYTNEERYM